MFSPDLREDFLRPLVHLCVSDANKTLLLQSQQQLLLSILLEALLVDPTHPRQVRTPLHIAPPSPLARIAGN